MSNVPSIKVTSSSPSTHSTPSNTISQKFSFLKSSATVSSSGHSSNKAPMKSNGISKSLSFSRPKKNKVHVKLLDNRLEKYEYEIHPNDLGLDVFNQICQLLGLDKERNYFGLRYSHTKMDEKVWLDLTKNAMKQMKHSNSRELTFEVKHYVNQPHTTLKTKIARYLFYLQLRDDMRQGHLIPSNLVRLCGLALQEEVASERSHCEGSNEDEIAENCLATLHLLPSALTAEESEDILNTWKSFRDWDSKQAEDEFIEEAGNDSLYGIHFMPVKNGGSHLSLYVSVSHSGLVVKSGEAMGTYAWELIDKVTVHGKKVYCHCRLADNRKSVLELKSTSNDAADNLWKLILDNKFFYTVETRPPATVKVGMWPFHRSIYRFSGLTQNSLLRAPGPSRNSIDRFPITRASTLSPIRSKPSRDNRMFHTVGHASSAKVADDLRKPRSGSIGEAESEMTALPLETAVVVETDPTDSSLSQLPSSIPIETSSVVPCSEQLVHNGAFSLDMEPLTIPEISGTLTNEQDEVRDCPVSCDTCEENRSKVISTSIENLIQVDEVTAEEKEYEEEADENHQLQFIDTPELTIEEAQINSQTYCQGLYNHNYFRSHHFYCNDLDSYDAKDDEDDFEPIEIDKIEAEFLAAELSQPRVSEDEVSGVGIPSMVEQESLNDSESEDFTYVANHVTNHHESSNTEDIKLVENAKSSSSGSLPWYLTIAFVILTVFFLLGLIRLFGDDENSPWSMLMNNVVEPMKNMMNDYNEENIVQQIRQNQWVIFLRGSVQNAMKSVQTNVLQPVLRLVDKGSYGTMEYT